jgi:mersacidin/lichenicidin family type 2 lantibiotic
MKSHRNLSKRQIARAWADPAYRASLSPELRDRLPANPAGPAGEEALEKVRGWGQLTFVNTCPTWTVFAGCCTNTCTNSDCNTCTCTCDTICPTSCQPNGCA